MRCWLSRQRNGSYMLTGLKPVIAKVGRSSHVDVYMRPGDPIGYRHMCEYSVEVLFGVTLEPLQSVRVEISGSPAEKR